MIHWHLAYIDSIVYKASDIDCTLPYWHEEQARTALNTHNINCRCRHLSIKVCDELVCVVRGLE